MFLVEDRRQETAMGLNEQHYLSIDNCQEFACLITVEVFSSTTHDSISHYCFMPGKSFNRKQEISLIESDCEASLGDDFVTDSS